MEFRFSSETTQEISGVLVQPAQKPAARSFWTRVGDAIRVMLGLPRSDDPFVVAIRELSAYTDAELADLGLARGDIEHAVRYGRPGLDEPVANDSAPVPVRKIA